eukprot:2423346-Amphidinium_carterae.3
MRTKILFMTCMLLLITALRSHFGTNVGLQARTINGYRDGRRGERQNTTSIDGNYIVIHYAARRRCRRRVLEDIRRLNEMLQQDVDDDMQSQIDEDHRREESEQSYEELCHRQAQETHVEYMDQMVRAQESNLRYERCRQGPDRARHPGSAARLHERYQGLHQQLMTARSTSRTSRNDDQKLHPQEYKYHHWSTRNTPETEDRATRESTTRRSTATTSTRRRTKNGSTATAALHWHGKT